MKYTYRDECIIQKGDMGSIILLIVLICNDIALFLAGFGFYLKRKDTSLLVACLLVTIITLLIAWSIIYSIKKRRKKALARRREALAKGTRYAGKIIDAGMIMETEKSETWDENNNRETNYRNLPNYWIDVEYMDAESMKAERVRSNHMVRSMEHLIGCGVDVYVWKEWDEPLQIDFTFSYIDTYAL